MNNRAAAAADVLGAKVTLLFCRNLVLFLRISSGGAVPGASVTRAAFAERPGGSGCDAQRGVDAARGCTRSSPRSPCRCQPAARRTLDS